jgi:hypothetical protein
LEEIRADKAERDDSYGQRVIGQGFPFSSLQVRSVESMESSQNTNTSVWVMLLDKSIYVLLKLYRETPIQTVPNMRRRNRRELARLHSTISETEALPWLSK